MRLVPCRPRLVPAWFVPSVAGLLLGLVGARLEAQLLRVHAVEEVSGRPAAGAIVDVLDSADAQVAQVVLSVEGRREIILVRPGTVRVRIRRIGFPPFLSEPLDVPAGSSDLELTLPARRVTLGAVKVSAARCAADAFADAGFTALWDEVHKALTSTSLGRGEASLAFETRAFRRTLRRDGRPRALAVGLPRAVQATRPYLAAAPADLASKGYIGYEVKDSTLMFHAPDEDVLRSSEFVATHCFSIVRGAGASAGLVGVQFTPARSRDRRGISDIAGTIWIDLATAELRHVDFRYESPMLPRDAMGDERSGGQVVFQRLPTGSWIVAAWRLRLPRLALPARRSMTPVVEGFDDYGGVVTPSYDADSVPAPELAPYLALLKPGTLGGTVFDSLAMRPLGGARVWVVPIEPAEAVRAGLTTSGTLNVLPTPLVADADGQWQMSGLAPGTYRVGFEHPVADSLALQPRWPELRLGPADDVTVSLATPSLPTLRDACEPLSDGRHPAGGLVTGLVRGRDGAPHAHGALVRATWRVQTVASRGKAPVVEEREANALAAVDGSYRLCGIPVGVPVVVRASTPADTTPPYAVQLEPIGIARLHLRFATHAGDSASDSSRDALALHASRHGDDELSRVHWRRLGGFGHTIAGDALHRHATTADALRALPDARLRTAAGGAPWELMLPQGNGECRARVFLDAGEVTQAHVRQATPRALAAIELYVDPARVPIFATGAPPIGEDPRCGALLLWSDPRASVGLSSAP